MTTTPQSKQLRKQSGILDVSKGKVIARRSIENPISLAQGCNELITAAPKETEIYILHHPDAKVSDEAAEELCEALERSGAGVAGPMALLDDGETIDHGGGLVPFPAMNAKTGILAEGHHGVGGFDIYTTSACIAITKYALVHCGLFDENYTDYYFFADFCLTARARGIYVLYVPEAQVMWPGDPIRRMYQHGEMPQGVRKKDGYQFWRKWVSNDRVYPDLMTEVFPVETGVAS